MDAFKGALHLRYGHNDWVSLGWSQQGLLRPPWFFTNGEENSHFHVVIRALWRSNQLQMYYNNRSTFCSVRLNVGPARDWALDLPHCILVPKPFSERVAFDEKVKCRKLDIVKLISRNLAVEIVEAWKLYVENVDSQNTKFKKRIFRIWRLIKRIRIVSIRYINNKS